MKPARSFGYRDWCAQLQFAEPQAVQFGLVAGGGETGKLRRAEGRSQRAGGGAHPPRRDSLVAGVAWKTRRFNASAQRRDTNRLRP
jgi:hypothetical protein